MKRLVPFIIILLLFIPFLYAPSRIKNALIIVDVQNTFFDGGALEIKDNIDIISLINILRHNIEYFDIIVLTKDEHCKEHVSFASFHPGHKVSDTIQISYNKDHKICKTKDTLNSKYTVDCNRDDIILTINQKLWPDHCIMNTSDAEFYKDLIISPSDIIIKKGYRCYIDSYSGFYDNGRLSETSLNNILKENGIKNVYITGIALEDFVYTTAKDARELNYDTFVIKDACKSTDSTKDIKIYQELADMGVHIINSNEIPFVKSRLKEHFYLILILSTLILYMRSIKKGNKTKTTK